MRAPRYDGPGLRVLTWNVASLRSLLKKDAGSIKRLIEAEALDVVCLQETKLQKKDVAAVEVSASVFEGVECARARVRACWGRRVALRDSRHGVDAAAQRPPPRSCARADTNLRARRRSCA